MGFSRQEYWSGLPFPFPGIFLTQRSDNISCPGRQILYHWASWEALIIPSRTNEYLKKKTTTYYVVHCDFCKAFNKISPDNWWKSENFLNVAIILICSHIWLTLSNKLWWLACCHLECYRWHKREFIGEMLESGLKNILHKHTWARKNKKKFER